MGTGPGLRQQRLLIILIVFTGLAVVLHLQWPPSSVSHQLPALRFIRPLPRQVRNQNPNLTIVDLNANVSGHFNKTVLKTKFGETPIFVHDSNKDIWVSATIVREGAWERGAIDIWQQYLQANPRASAFDIGTNLGIYGLAAVIVGRPAIFVEPLLVNVLRLTKSIQAGNFQRLSTVVHNAVSNSRRVVYFRSEKGNVGGTQILDHKHKALADQSYGRALTVTMDDLSDLCEGRDLVMKMDVECHEKQALQTARYFLVMRRVSVIFMEWRSCTSDTDETASFVHNLAGYGFQPYKIDFPPSERLSEAAARKGWPGDVLWINSRYFNKTT